MCEDTRKDKQRAQLGICEFIAEFTHLIAPFLVVGRVNSETISLLSRHQHGAKLLILKCLFRSATKPHQFNQLINCLLAHVA